MIKKPVLVCDIDDVLFPFVCNIIKYHNDLKGTAHTEEDFLNFDFENIWGETEKEAIEIVDNFMLMDHVNFTPVEGAKEALGRLKQDFTVVLVTARNELFTDNTERWLKLHLNDLFHDVVFAGNHYDGRGHRPKGEVCKGLGAVLMIDDQPNNILSVAAEGINCILFGEKAWAKTTSALPDNVVRCKDWETTLEYIYDEWQSN